MLKLSLCRPANILQWLEVPPVASDRLDLIILIIFSMDYNHHHHHHSHDHRCKDIYAARGGSLTDKQICAGGQPGKVAVDDFDEEDGFKDNDGIDVDDKGAAADDGVQRTHVWGTAVVG